MYNFKHFCRTFFCLTWLCAGQTFAQENLPSGFHYEPKLKLVLSPLVDAQGKRKFSIAEGRIFCGALSNRSNGNSKLESLAKRWASVAFSGTTRLTNLVWSLPRNWEVAASGNSSIKPSLVKKYYSYFDGWSAELKVGKSARDRARMNPELGQWYPSDSFTAPLLTDVFDSEAPLFGSRFGSVNNVFYPESNFEVSYSPEAFRTPYGNIICVGRSK